MSNTARKSSSSSDGAGVSARAETVGELGEFALIERLARLLPPLRSDVRVGIGDDVAVLALGPDRLLLATCDAQVAGTHFVAERCDARRLGRKAAAINLSDIAAAGGSPTHFLVSLVLPPETPVEFLDGLYIGLAEEAGRYGADVVGGNVSGGERLVIDLTLLGTARAGDLLRRDGARPGDRVLVTGRLGAARAGLALALDPRLLVADDVRRAAADAFETPTPRVAESAAIVRTGGASSAIDISDGLAADLGHICDASRVGVRLLASALPVAHAAEAVAPLVGASAAAWALGGGEDYELAFTAPPDRAVAIARAVVTLCGTAIADVGEIVEPDHGRSIRAADGAERPLTSEGWRHF